MLGKTWFSLPSGYHGNQLLEVTSLLSLNVYHGNQERKTHLYDNKLMNM